MLMTFSSVIFGLVNLCWLAPCAKANRLSQMMDISTQEPEAGGQTKPIKLSTNVRDSNQQLLILQYHLSKIVRDFDFGI